MRPVRGVVLLPRCCNGKRRRLSGPTRRATVSCRCPARRQVLRERHCRGTALLRERRWTQAPAAPFRRWASTGARGGTASRDAAAWRGERGASSRRRTRGSGHCGRLPSADRAWRRWGVAFRDPSHGDGRRGDAGLGGPARMPRPPSHDRPRRRRSRPPRGRQSPRPPESAREGGHSRSWASARRTGSLVKSRITLGFYP